MNNYQPDRELRTLVDRLHDGPPLSAAEMARLEVLLQDDNRLMYYLSVSRQEALLTLAIPPDAPRLETPVTNRKIPRKAWIAPAAGFAACLVFFLGLQFGRRLGQPTARAAAPAPAANSAPARITGMVGVEWAGNGTHPQIELGETFNRVSIKSGLMEITYANGVRTTLEGPAIYHVDGRESGRLEKGKLYATVPKGSEGFKVHYSGGTVEDLGTEFAMDALPDGSTEVGVFLGKVKLHSPGRDTILLFENQSLLQSPDAAEPLQPIPLDRDKFVQRLPARDFSWELNSAKPREVTFDVTHLIWKPARYRAIFKWISGPDAALVRNVRLCCDSQTVVEDSHPGSTGKLRFVSDNIYSLDIGPEDYRRGKWTVVATMETMNRDGGKLSATSPPISSRGILQLEEGLVTEAGPEQFVGRWSYRYMGDAFIREFHHDGSVSLEKNGTLEDIDWQDSRWVVEDGILRVTIPKKGLVENHVLRNLETLVFVSNPYENAIKSEPD